MLRYFKKTRTRYFNEKATFNPFIEYLKENTHYHVYFSYFLGKNVNNMLNI